MSDAPQTPPPPSFPLRFAQVLVPVDMRHRDVSRSAIAAGAWVARQTSATLYLLTVARPFGKSMTDFPAVKEPDFKTFVAAESAQFDYAMTPLFRSHESVDHVIRQVVKRFGIDFAVMATHHPRLSDHLFGSHAAQAALHTDCSVLILRP